jgi:hypothetical protein
VCLSHLAAISLLVVWAHRPVRPTCPTSLRLLLESFGLFQPCRLRSSSPGRWLVPYRDRRAGRGSRRGHGAGHCDCQQTLFFPIAGVWAYIRPKTLACTPQIKFADVYYHCTIQLQYHTMILVLTVMTEVELGD